MASIYVPQSWHLEFLFPLVVLMTITLTDNRSTFDASVAITLLLLIDLSIKQRDLPIDQLIFPFLLPVIFVWATTFAVIKYKESQLKLLRSTEYLNAMFKYATEGIIISDQKGEIILANPTSSKQLGYENGELVGKKIEQLVPDRFAEHHPRHRKGYYQQPQSRSMGKSVHLSAKRKDGTEVPVEISLSSFRINHEMYVISFIIDITERHRQEQLIRKSNEELEFRVISRTMELAALNKSLEQVNTNLKAEMEERSKAEEALRDSERLYSTIAHNFPDGFICVLDHSLHIVFIDGQELDRLNIHSNSYIGKSWRTMNICSDKKLEEMEAIFQKAFQWETSNTECEFKDQVYNLVAVPLPDDKGDVKEILMVVRNITRAKKAETEILQSLEKERALNEMKSRFVSMASHEFRTPLSTILSSLALVSRYREEAERPKQEKHIERIKSSVKNLTEILNDFLSIEKLEAGKVEVHPETIQINQLCEELTEEMQAVAGQGQKIVYRHLNGDSTIFSDKQLLRNIFINLLNNAIKYSKENGIIEFTSEVNHGIHFTVTDHGIGIPGEDQAQLFERFFRATNVTNIQGTGLGLNIVRRYTDLLNGDIRFVSEIDKGTTFHLTFPIITKTQS